MLDLNTLKAINMPTMWSLLARRKRRFDSLLKWGKVSKEDQAAARDFHGQRIAARREANSAWR